MITPIRDWIVIKPIPCAETVVSGIVIPTMSNDTIGYAEVLAVGPGVPGVSGELVFVGVVVGETVMYNAKSGTPIRIDGIECKLVQPHNIFGSLKIQKEII